MSDEVQPPVTPELPVEDFLVFYSLTGVTLASAASEEAARQKVLGDLRTFISETQTHRGCIGPAEAAARFRLGDVKFEIDSVEQVIFQCQPAEDEYPTTEVTGIPAPAEISEMDARSDEA